MLYIYKPWMAHKKQDSCDLFSSTFYKKINSRNNSRNFSKEAGIPAKEGKEASLKFIKQSW